MTDFSSLITQVIVTVRTFTSSMYNNRITRATLIEPVVERDLWWQSRNMAVLMGEALDARE